MPPSEDTGLRSIGKDTPTKLSLATLVMVLAAITGAVYAGARAWADIQWEIRSLRDTVNNDLPKRGELRDLEVRMTGVIGRQMKHAILRCPRQASRAGAGSWMDCQVIFSNREE